ncbi:restriction endonuclease subunit R, partial [bacterium]|nr:restriction endonuclease subunit R [bacterium]
QNVDRPLEKIRRFRNRPEPNIVVTVDMLSTGVEVPTIECIIFMRPVKSRILWEQMLGRGTRLCVDIHKDSFTIFDCFGGSLIEYFKDASNFKFESITTDPISITEIIRRINDNEDRDYHVKVLVKRLRRIEKNMSGGARKEFSKFIPNGDIGNYAEELQGNIKSHFPEAMNLLNDIQFQNLLVNYQRAKSTFLVAYSAMDDVSSQLVFKEGEKYLQPEEYLSAFSHFVRKHQDRIGAVKILLERPKEWRTTVLKELRLWLLKNDFSETDLRNAHRIVYQKELADIISMIKHAVHEQEPVLNVDERVNNAVERVFKGKILTDEQQAWVDYIKEYLIQNLTIEEEDLKNAPIFERHGGFTKFKKVFKEDYKVLIENINTAIAA